MRYWQAALVFAMAHESAVAALSRHIASYDIKARYDAAAKSITGSERLTWLNDSPDQVGELRFHLYMNAFKNEKSTFMREAGGRHRGYRAKEDAWGYIDIKRLSIAEGADLTRVIEFIQPDDGNKDDQTVIRVPLPRPVGPGKTIELDIEFYTKLPRVFARTGYHADFVFAGQWFPKIGVWEKAGMRCAAKGQWNCHQFHLASEFYADFGRYRVELTLPANYIAGATGVESNVREDTAARTKTCTFVQEDVHDFAWTASPVYLKLERMFRAADEVPPKELAEHAALFGISEDEVRLRDVKMIVLLQPEHARQADRHFHAVRAALKYFGLWYGRYPYDTITVVDPPYGAGGAGGMEYPTLITAGTRWIVSPGEQTPEMVTVHEFGHQFWYLLVATNEFEESWLDEGFNTYSTSKIMDKVYGPSHLSGAAFAIPLGMLFKLPARSWDSINRSAYLSGPKDDAVVRNAWEYIDFGSYALNSYMRPGALLKTLENILGEKIMARAMRTYHQRWRFKHPATRDFIAVVNEVAGRDLGWFFDQVVFGSNVLDYSVDSVTSKEIGLKAGVYDKDGGRITVTQDDVKKDAKQRGNEKNKMYESAVVIRRKGEVVFPVDVRITFGDGTVADKQWDGQYRWVKFKLERPAKVTSVEVDPQRKLLLDVNLANNSWREKADHGAAVKISAAFLFWVQNLLLAAASVL